MPLHGDTHKTARVLNSKKHDKSVRYHDVFGAFRLPCHTHSNRHNTIPLMNAHAEPYGSSICDVFWQTQERRSKRLKKEEWSCAKLLKRLSSFIAKTANRFLPQQLVAIWPTPLDRSKLDEPTQQRRRLHTSRLRRRHDIVIHFADCGNARESGKVLEAVQGINPTPGILERAV